MSKFYLYALTAMILLPFGVIADHIYGEETIIEAVFYQENIYDVSLLTYNESGVDSQEEPDKPKVQLFPNPNEGEFTLKIAEDIWQGATATLHNIIGLEIDRRTVSLGENSYSISECQPGIYFLTLQQGDLQKVLRFVKR
ncbi:MAG: T9SS type A sorting domain-containing protein [Bacteroidota bacterium]